MTSTISSEKKVFIKLLKWAFLRNRARLIVFSILMALGIFLDMYAIHRYTSMHYIDPVSLNSWLRGMGTDSIIIAQAGSMLFVLISAIHTFSFLHNKRTTDMFGAIPATRGQLYFSHLISGMASVIIPFTVGSFIVMALTCRTGEAFSVMLGLILFGIVSVAAAYSFTALIAYCCGTVVDTAIVTITVNVIYSGIAAFFSGAAASMIPGLSYSRMLSTPVLGLFSPYSFFIYYDVYSLSAQPTAMWITVIWSVAFTVGLIVLGYFAAKKRRAEVAQNEFNIRWLPVVIKAGMSVVCGGLVGIIAASAADFNFGNMFVFTFWYIVAGFAAFLILHLIFARGLKGKFLHSLFAYIGTTTVSLLLVFAMTTGIGLDTYVPDASNIRSVSIIIGYEETEFSEPESIELITDIHKVVIDGELSLIPHPYYLGSASYMRKNYYNFDYEANLQYPNKFPLSYNFLSSAIRFSYSKKIGFDTYREYIGIRSNYDVFDSEKLETLLRSFYNTDEFKKKSNSSLWAEEGAKRKGKSPTIVTLSTHGRSTGPDDNRMASSKYTSTGAKAISHDESFVTGLMDAMRQDIMDDREYYKVVSPMWSEDESVSLGSGFLSVWISYSDNYVMDPYSSNYYAYDSNADDINVIIPESYTKTRNYLIENGVSVTGGTAVNA